jgi:hypothetical protein
VYNAANFDYCSANIDLGYFFLNFPLRQIPNPLRWEKVRLNLPGNPTYDPTLPRLMKWDKGVDNIAGDIIGFVDDLRSSSRAKEESWQISRQVASRLQYLGIQDTPMKRRTPVQNHGAWAGAIFSTSEGKITQTVS